MTRDRLSSTPLRSLVLLGALWVGCSGTEAEDPEYLRGLNALAEGRHVWARIHFAAAAEATEPEDAARLEGVAWLSGPSQSLASAVESFERSLEIRPEQPDVQLRLARCLVQMGAPERARRVIAGLPSTPELELLRAELLLDTEPERALQLAAAIADDQPERPRALALVSEAYGRQGRVDEAVASAVESLRLDPLQEQVWYRLGRLHVRRGEVEPATRAVDISQLLAELDRSEDKRPEAERLRLLRRLEEELDSRNPLFAARRAELLIAGGTPQEARAAMDDLAAVAEPSIDLRLDFIAMLLRRRDPEDAEERLRAVLEEAPSHRRARDLMIRLLLTRGDLEAARALAEAGREEEPHLARFELRLGQVELASGNHELAREHWDRALHLAPWQAEWRLELVRLLLDEGRRTEAIRRLDEAPESHPALDAFRRQRGLGNPT